MKDGNKLFSYGDVKQTPHRSGFDLSNKNAFTAKAGELLPVYWKFTLPGDKFNLGVEHFTRTQPVQTSAFTRIREYFDWYFVPFRLMNKNLPQAIMNMQEQAVQGSAFNTNQQIYNNLPVTPLSTISQLLSSISTVPSGQELPSNAFGFRLSATSAKLLYYMGVRSFKRPDTSSTYNSDFFGLTGTTAGNENFLNFQVNQSINLLPFFAYQKIYADYFRFEQWERAQAYTFNFNWYKSGNFFPSIGSDTVTYMKGANIFTLRYGNWHKDMFMGALPSSQLGSIATVSVSENALIPVVAASAVSGGSGLNQYSLNASKSSGTVSVSIGNPGSSTVFSSSPLYASGSTSSGFYPFVNNELFDIISLRLAEATQRYREISQCHGQNYKDQIYAHFGVKLSDALSDRCRYIGGSASNIDISEVMNTNLDGADSKANIAGKGVGTDKFNENFYCEEPGVLMCIYHCSPVLDYVLSSNDMQLWYTQTTDFPLPAFDSIGMQSLPVMALTNSFSLKVNDTNLLPSMILGYVPRYIEYKTSVDIVQGAFTTTLKDWCAPLDSEYLTSWWKKAMSGGDIDSRYDTYPYANANFFRMNPSLLDNIFAVAADSTWDTDQFLVNAFFDVKVARNLDYNGMPY